MVELGVAVEGVVEVGVAVEVEGVVEVEDVVTAQPARRSIRKNGPEKNRSMHKLDNWLRW